MLRPLRLGLLLAMSIAPCACTYRTPRVGVPAALPALATRDVDVTVVRRGGIVDRDLEAIVRRETAELLMQGGGAHDALPSRAKVRARVEIVDERDVFGTVGKCGIGCAAIVAPAVPLGADIDREEVRVDVVVEAEDRTFAGRGAATAFGSIYAPARRRAIALALDRALAASAR